MVNEIAEAEAQEAEALAEKAAAKTKAGKAVANVSVAGACEPRVCQTRLPLFISVLGPRSLTDTAQGIARPPAPRSLRSQQVGGASSQTALRSRA